MALVRVARPEDAPVVVEFNRAMALETENIELPPDVLEKGVATALAGGVGATYYLLEVEGKVVAQLMITTEWSDWRATQAWWIQSVFVHPDHRRKGYFRMLYKHVQQEAARVGACGLRLYADNDNSKAHTTYENLGMKSHYKVYEDLFTKY